MVKGNFKKTTPVNQEFLQTDTYPKPYCEGHGDSVNRLIVEKKMETTAYNLEFRV